MEELLQLLLETLVQGVVQVLVELGFHTLAAPFRRESHPVMASCGYLMLGAIAGGLSLLALPAHLVHGSAVRGLNLVITPLAIGALSWALGQWREMRGSPRLRIDRFFYGYLFAFAFALIRFEFAT